MIPFLVLPLLGCAPEEPVELESLEDFFRAAAKASCTQVIACEPESWLALDGQEPCELEQLLRMRGMFGSGGSARDDLDAAQACLDAMAVLTCDEQVVDGFIPPICWDVRQWDGDIDDEGDRPTF